MTSTGIGDCADAPPAASTSRAASARSRAHRIDVSRVGLDRQLREPACRRLRVDAVWMAEALAFAERGVEAREAERGTARQRIKGDVALDGGELEGQRAHRLRQAGERLRLETLDVDL